MDSDFIPRDNNDAAYSRAEYRPRLSIFHLMLWMLCSGIHLTIGRAQIALDAGITDPFYQYFHRIAVVLSSATTGAVVTGAVVLISARLLHGFIISRQPGYWLLLVHAGLTVLHLILSIFLTIASRNWSLAEVYAHWANMLMTVYGLTFLGAAVAFASAVPRIRTIRWKGFFIGASVASLLSCAAHLPFHNSIESRWFMLFGMAGGGNFVMVIWSLVVALLDRVLREGRDWLHWTGVAAYSADALLTAVWLAVLASMVI